VILLYELGFGVKKTLKKLLPIFRQKNLHMCSVTIKNYKENTLVYNLPYDMIRIGKNKEYNTIQIDHQSVNEKQLVAKVIGKEIEIEDFGSNYGTYYNGNRVSKQVIPNNSTIKIGKIEITIFFRKDVF
jgi:pSer/pThr/pTyr-binding forkhead associated (FHA) protein